MKIYNLLAATYRAITFIDKYPELKSIRDKLEHKLISIERSLRQNNIDDDDDITNMINLFSSQHHLRDNTYYVVNFLYMGVLFSRGVDVKECYNRTLSSFDNPIVRVATRKFLSPKYFVILLSDEQNEINTLYKNIIPENEQT